MTRNAMPAKRQPTLEPIDEEVDHVRGPTAGRLIVEYGDYECPSSRRAFREIERVERQLVHRGAYDAAALLEALAR